ncbi:hypothetical protein [Paenibacillus apis]|uniref:Response receiver domain-containing protein n=1 Tax=Paenibacillus apis TaxID=1792174 RepID=A0A920CL92_9BACL|nr:hypothetical protein [Paenibacillus apis]GIO41394.1 hypothetical protein J41TS4_11520 [Paenibacillus apis]
MELKSIDKVLVIDDRIEEALPIMKALSSKGVYSLFWDTQSSTKPETPLSGIRLVILDMRVTSSNDSHIINQTLFTLLNHAISQDNGPYILCVWSKHTSEYYASFCKTIRTVRVPQPYLITSLEKKNFIRIEEDIYKDTQEQLASALSNLDSSIADEVLDIFENIPVGFEDREFDVENLLKKLDEELIKMNSLSTLLLWENTVSKAANLLVNNMARLSSIDMDWDNNIKNIIFRLALANGGKSLENNVVTNEYIMNAFSSLSQMLPDELLTQISQLKFEEDRFQLASNSSVTHLEKGLTYSIYKTSKGFKVNNCDGKEILTFKKIGEAKVVKSADRDIITKLYEKYQYTLGFANTKLLCQKSLASHPDKPGRLYVCQDKIIKDDITKHAFKNIFEEANSIELVYLDISSACDYAQNKLVRKRIVYGVKVPLRQYLMSECKTSDSLYTTPELLVGEENCRFVFSFHHISNIPTEYLNKSNLEVLEFREMFVNEIKHHLSSFISRIGIIKLD